MKCVENDRKVISPPAFIKYFGELGSSIQIPMAPEKIREVDNQDGMVPKDSYYLVMLLFFLFGLGGLVPGQFFLTATDFWMYKFRDISSDTYDLRNKTFLQKNFIATSSITNSIPTIITSFLSSYAAHKMNIRKRFLGTLFAITTIFVIFLAFVVINTDTWQLPFFIMTMTIFAGLSIVGTLFEMSCLTLLSRFPPNYIKVCLLGMTMSGVVSAALQIACLGIGGTSKEVGLFYFSTGSVILVTTLISAYFSKHLPFYNYYCGNPEIDTKRPLPSYAEILNICKRIWPFIFITVIQFPTVHTAFPTITSQVVSEGYGQGNLWNDKFFVPTISFLLYDAVGLTGRIFALPFLKPKIIGYWIIFLIIKTYTLPVLFLFCNALPRHNLPVLFPHDWQYMMIICANAFVDSYVAAVVLMSMKSFTGEGTDLAFMILQSVGRTVYSASSPLGSVYVNLL